MHDTNSIPENDPTSHQNTKENIESRGHRAWPRVIRERTPNNSGGGNLPTHTLLERRIVPVARFFIAQQMDLIIRRQVQQVAQDLGLAERLQDPIIANIK